MFTGIIEKQAIVNEIMSVGSNLDIWLESPIAKDLKIDQSVAHNGVCLTVVETQDDRYRVTAVAETLAKTNLNSLKKNDTVNLERALKVGDRLDGHFVQGHVDCVATCIEKQKLEGSWLYRFRFPLEHSALVIEKGSICINGVSLTIFDVGDTEFTVTIIPYTYGHTNFAQLDKGTLVNIEYDVLGKYLQRKLSLTNN